MARDFAKHLPFPEAKGRKKKKRPESRFTFTVSQGRELEAGIRVDLVKNRSMQAFPECSSQVTGDFAKGQEMGGGQWVAGEVPSQGFEGTMPTGETILRLY